MKYIEFVYLAASVVLLVILANGFGHFTSVQIIMLIVSIVVTSFMFSFRRKQRKTFEKIEQERVRKMEEEAQE